MNARNSVRILLIAYLFLVAGCASYNWRQTEAVNTATVHKIEQKIVTLREITWQD